ncbi:hypothetical protein BGW38_008397 [Lunasporangiospora selenospora]|uniref:Uncharacterized protein n=1 Tax=Lunasporangiospora selenospora TaxID=979761 RepID=A0A9P6KFP1_9FUNG|nr:hypothetical protein BGW38_008397 [Lunasporangiospora selenospora]
MTVDDHATQKLWKLTNELTAQLVFNRNATLELKQQLADLQAKAAQSAIAVNHDFIKYNPQEYADLNLRIANERLVEENTQLQEQVREYEKCLEFIMAKFRLQNELAVRLQQENTVLQARLVDVGAVARKAISDEYYNTEAIIETLEIENQGLRELLGVATEGPVGALGARQPGNRVSFPSTGSYVASSGSDWERDRERDRERDPVSVPAQGSPAIAAQSNGGQHQPAMGRTSDGVSQESGASGSSSAKSLSSSPTSSLAISPLPTTVPSTTAPSTNTPIAAASVSPSGPLKPSDRPIKAEVTNTTEGSNAVKKSDVPETGSQVRSRTKKPLEHENKSVGGSNNTSSRIGNTSSQATAGTGARKTASTSHGSLTNASSSGQRTTTKKSTRKTKV